MQSSPPPPPYTAFAQSPKPARSSSPWLWALGIILAFLLGCAALVFFFISSIASSIASADFEPAHAPKTSTLTQGSNSKVAIIEVTGVISDEKRGSSTMAEQIITQIEHARSSKSIKAVVLYVNSPGGGVTPSDNIYHALTKLAREKPLVVYMDSLAASGGYYISCASQHIVANPTTLTGSIGVIISGFNASELMQKVGVKSRSFTSGEFKEMLSPFKDMSNNEQVYVQTLVNQMYGRFLSIVTTSRKSTPEKLRNVSLPGGQSINAIDGRILSSDDALAAGLIDEIGYLENAIQKASSLANLSNPTVIRYNQSIGLMDLLSSMSAQSARVEVAIPGPKGIQIQQGVPYMLPSSFAAQP